MINLISSVIRSLDSNITYYLNYSRKTAKIAVVFTLTSSHLEPKIEYATIWGSFDDKY